MYISYCLGFLTFDFKETNRVYYNKTNNIFIKYGHDRSENSSPDLYSRFHFLLKNTIEFWLLMDIEIRDFYLILINFLSHKYLVSLFLINMGCWYFDLGRYITTNNTEFSPQYTKHCGILFSYYNFFLYRFD